MLRSTIIYLVTSVVQAVIVQDEQAWKKQAKWKAPCWEILWFERKNEEIHQGKPPTLEGNLPCWGGGKFCPACREINIFSRPEDEGWRMQVSDVKPGIIEFHTMVNNQHRMIATRILWANHVTISVLTLDVQILVPSLSEVLFQKTKARSHYWSDTWRNCCLSVIVTKAANSRESIPVMIHVASTYENQLS